MSLNEKVTRLLKDQRLNPYVRTCLKTVYVGVRGIYQHEYNSKLLCASPNKGCPLYDGKNCIAGKMYFERIMKDVI
jgi:hypothetical protein